MHQVKRNNIYRGRLKKKLRKNEPRRTTKHIFHPQYSIIACFHTHSSHLKIYTWVVLFFRFFWYFFSLFFKLHFALFTCLCASVFEQTANILLKFNRFNSNTNWGKDTRGYAIFFFVPKSRIQSETNIISRGFFFFFSPFLSTWTVYFLYVLIVHVQKLIIGFLFQWLLHNIDYILKIKSKMCMVRMVGTTNSQPKCERARALTSQLVRKWIDKIKANVLNNRIIYTNRLCELNRFSSIFTLFTCFYFCMRAWVRTAFKIHHSNQWWAVCVCVWILQR